MIIYSVTVSVDEDVHEEWVSWMKQTHIPDVMATGFFVENRFAKVLLAKDEGGIPIPFSIYVIAWLTFRNIKARMHHDFKNM